MWFRNWIRTTKVYLGQYPQWYKCYSPQEMRKNNITFDEYNPTIEACTIVDLLVPTVTSVSLTIVFLIGLLPLIYKCRWHIRYRIYLLKQKQYRKILNEEEFVYWGFVIYSDNDRDWVHRELIHHLEEKEGLPLCIRLRDFDVGKVIVDNIVENMNCSKKIILILSNNFANSDWCRFEFLLAQDRIVSEGLECLVLIMLEEINSNNLNSGLHALITTSSYAAWSTEEPALELFWEQVITAVKYQVNSNTQCLS
ncbi:hypothetical protein KUTeg_010896 [Tegillarca granosa]|uniref:TIR domain-containing protein n=1 Tax=Tegillarca granosa TaxID=220873 RepID=A0ABQ9F2C3_TEGGR|nr:hypothetical protein KUTeg_010896 [Tegillarca granosa]